MYFVDNILLSFGCSLAEGMVRNKDYVPLPSFYLSKIEEISLSSIFSTKRGAMTGNEGRRTKSTRGNNISMFILFML